jgi:dienelactone hydrolase
LEIKDMATYSDLSLLNASYIRTGKIALALLTIFAFFTKAHANDAFPTNDLEKLEVLSAKCTGWFRQASWKCEPIKVPVYLGSSIKQSKKAIVIISHGSQGIDLHHRWYLDHLVKEGFHAIAIDHWQPRGIGSLGYSGYASGSLNQGGNAMNQAIDVVAVAKWIRANPKFKDFKIGHIGESMSAAVGRELNKEGYLSNLVTSALGTVEQSLDAFTAMYMGCSERNMRDRFLNKPVLLINGSLDDQTTLEACQKYLPWYNERGGNAQLVEIPNEYHHFDNSYKLQYFSRPENPRDCANIVDTDKGTITDDKTGKVYKNNAEGFAEHRKSCMTRGVHAGSRNQKPGNSFEIWTRFFNTHLEQ